MLLTVNRSAGNGAYQLAAFAPTDFSGCVFQAQIGWPDTGPGGSWSVFFRLVDADGGIWDSDAIAGTNPSAPVPNPFYLRPYAIGPQTIAGSGFDVRRLSSVWLLVALAPMSQVFQFSIDWVKLGAPAMNPWAISPNVFTAGLPQTLFAGYIASFEMQDEQANDGNAKIAYSCRDYRIFTDSRQVTLSVPNGDYYDDQIAALLIQNADLIPPLSLGTLQRTMLCPYVVEGEYLTSALDKLCKATGLVWSIDQNGVVNYLQPAAQPQRIELTDQPGGDNFKVERFSETWYAPANVVQFHGGGGGLLVTVQDDASIATYGKFQMDFVDLSVTDSGQALQLAQNALARYSTPLVSASLVFWTVGAQPGMVAKCTSSRYGWTAEEFEIQRVELKQLTDAAWQTEVHAEVGDFHPDIADAINQIAEEVAMHAGINVTVNGA